MTDTINKIINNASTPVLLIKAITTYKILSTTTMKLIRKLNLTAI